MHQVTYENWQFFPYSWTRAPARSIWRRIIHLFNQLEPWRPDVWLWPRPGLLYGGLLYGPCSKSPRRIFYRLWVVHMYSMMGQRAILYHIILLSEIQTLIAEIYVYVISERWRRYCSKWKHCVKRNLIIFIIRSTYISPDTSLADGLL